MNVTRPSEISEILHRYGISVRKSWGQNFLTSEGTVQKILAEACLDGSEAVLEIGPGLGVMTSRLINLASNVVAIEIDPMLCRFLRERFAQESKFRLIQGDALDQDFSALMPNQYVVVANLPYYITSAILAKLIEQPCPPKLAVLLVQWEVGKRIAALPGTSSYGALTVMIQYHCQTELLHRVNPGNFFPPPKVDSAVVRMRWHPPAMRPNNEKLMFKIVRVAFGQRRKMLKGLLAREFGLDLGTVVDSLEKLGLSGDIRGEKLSVQDFAALTDLLEGGMR